MCLWRKWLGRERKVVQNLLEVFSSLCAVSYRLRLDDTPSRETDPFTISPTLTWTVLHTWNKPRIVSAQDWETLRGDIGVNWQPKEISTNFSSLCLYTFQGITTRKVHSSFLMRCENWWYAVEKIIFVGVKLKSQGLQSYCSLTMGNWLTDVTCIHLLRFAS